MKNPTHAIQINATDYVRAAEALAINIIQASAPVAQGHGVIEVEVKALSATGIVDALSGAGIDLLSIHDYEMDRALAPSEW